QKEASSELLASICGALDLPLSTVLSTVSEKLARQELLAKVPTIRPVASVAAA
ncbi:MAG TPA: XRE family transcriptional regulator, partial [Microlunatus sp.]|nr:XRE family transcriptional regulator [Microlunatus sp.]